VPLKQLPASTNTHALLSKPLKLLEPLKLPPLLKPLKLLPLLKPLKLVKPLKLLPLLKPLKLLPLSRQTKLLLLLLPLLKPLKLLPLSRQTKLLLLPLPLLKPLKLLPLSLLKTLKRPPLPLLKPLPLLPLSRQTKLLPLPLQLLMLLPLPKLMMYCAAILRHRTLPNFETAATTCFVRRSRTHRPPNSSTASIWPRVRSTWPTTIDSIDFNEKLGCVSDGFLRFYGHKRPRDFTDTSAPEILRTQAPHARFYGHKRPTRGLRPREVYGHKRPKFQHASASWTRRISIAPDATHYFIMSAKPSNQAFSA
jgi:hypothetical protein